MYRRRRQSSGSCLFTAVLLGVIAGCIFMWVDREPVASVQALTAARPTAASIPLMASPVSPPLALPSPVKQSTTIFVPTAGIFTSIIQVYLDGTSWDVSQLGQNAGHLQGTAWFDSRGNVALAGHVEMSDGRPGIFASLSKLHAGEPIEVQFEGSLFRYYVTDVTTTSPDDLTILYPSTTDRLTLITCGAYNLLQDAYLERIVVVAERAA